MADKAMYVFSSVTDDVLTEVFCERARQNAKWGEQNLPDGTDDSRKAGADRMREICDVAAAAGTVTWMHVLSEETLEAFAESAPSKLRTELLQVAAVAVAWIEAIDRRGSDAVIGT